MPASDIQKSATTIGKGIGKGGTPAAIGAVSARERFPKTRLRLKGCERCGGDTTTGYDWHGGYLRCLQCGWYKDEPGDALSGLVETSMRSLMEDMENYNRAQRRAS